MYKYDMIWYMICHIFQRSSTKPLVRKPTCGFGQQNFWNQWRWSKSTASRLRWRDYGLNMSAIICEAFEDIEGVWKIYTSTLQFHLCSSASSVPLQLLGILPHGFAIAWHGTGSSVELKPGLTLLRQCCDSGQSPDLTMPTKQELRDDTEKWS